MTPRGRPATGVTKQHNVRVPEELWDAAMEEAEIEGTTVTAWINIDLDKRVKAARRKRARAERQED